MKAVHPFPARMAPDALSRWIEQLPEDSTVLDPMCGSGVVLRQSILAGHRSIGFDVDPLAVLMSRVWTTRIKLDDVIAEAEEVCERAQALRARTAWLPWMAQCEETQEFVDYWFAKEQQESLRRISIVLKSLEENRPGRLTRLFWLALSRTIVTKQAGASLAWDVSHSRPHRVRDQNEFDVYRGFVKAVKVIVTALDDKKLPRNAMVEIGDGRDMSPVPSESVDAIFSSPPYLNAIDYLRGHKLSLVWMGYTIPEIRKIRAGSVGAERAPDKDHFADVWRKVEKKNPAFSQLDQRHRNMVRRYVHDATSLVSEFGRVIKRGAILGLVIGDCSVRGVMVENSKIYDTVATLSGFKKVYKGRRAIEASKRYLPQSSKTNALERRMRYETIQVYEAVSCG